jgi:hypothetical protein
MRFLRFALAFPIGLMVMFAVVSSVEFLGHQVAPPSPEMKAAIELHLKQDPGAAEAMRAALPTMPVLAFISVLLAWIAGAVGGTYAACRVAGAMQLPLGIAMGAMVALAALVNLLILPHPSWMWPAGLALPIAAGVLMGRWMAEPLAYARSQRG